MFHYFAKNEDVTKFINEMYKNAGEKNKLTNKDKLVPMAMLH